MSKAKQLADVLVYDPASFDNDPVEMPVHLKVAVSQRDEMLRLIREELSRAAEDRGEESFEEAEDFDMNDDLPYSQYELTPLQEEYILHPERFSRKGDDDGSAFGSDGKGSGKGSDVVRDKADGKERFEASSREAGGSVPGGVGVLEKGLDKG